MICGSPCTSKYIVHVLHHSLHAFYNRSEGPAQVFLIVLVWMMAALRNMTQQERQRVIISYDNMCHLDNLKVAKEPLPLPDEFKYMWLDVKKIIDSLHMKNHKDKRCKELYSPEGVKKENAAFNTMCCEQTFTWLGRYKKILAAMGKCHHHFFLHRVVKKRNEYITHCYNNGRRPVMPQANRPRYSNNTQ